MLLHEKLQMSYSLTSVIAFLMAYYCVLEHNVNTAKIDGRIFGLTGQNIEQFPVPVTCIFRGVDINEKALSLIEYYFKNQLELRLNPQPNFANSTGIDKIRFRIVNFEATQIPNQTQMCDIQIQQIF